MVCIQTDEKSYMLNLLQNKVCKNFGNPNSEFSVEAKSPTSFEFVGKVNHIEVSICNTSFTLVLQKIVFWYKK